MTPFELQVSHSENYERYRYLQAGDKDACEASISLSGKPVIDIWIKHLPKAHQTHWYYFSFVCMKSFA